MHIRFCTFLLLAGGVFLSDPNLPTASAAPFTPEQCNGLRQLHHELEARGVGATVAKGAKWAGDNLNAEQLSEVGAFLKLGEEIRFRCGKSTVGKKKQSALNVNIPLPVRNSRRVLKEKAEKAKPALPTAPPSPKTDGEISPEEKSVLSAVTDEKSDEPKEGASGSNNKPSKK